MAQALAVPKRSALAASLPPLEIDEAVKPTRSHLMMGGCSIAGLFRECSEAGAVATVRTALGAGVTHFDTAPHYGLGVAEERLQTAISPLGDDLCPPNMQSVEANAAIQKLREGGQIKIWTKAGKIVCATGTAGAILQVGGVDDFALYDLVKNTPRERDELLDYSAHGASRSLTASECRLGGRQRVAGLRVHDADTDELVAECLKPDGILAGLRGLREAGRIDQVSLGMNMVVAPQILRLLREAPKGTFDNIMLAHGWNLLCQDGLEVMQECHARGIQIHNAGVYCSGLLVGGDTYFYGKAAPEMIEKAKAWGAIADKHNVPLASVAIAFGLWPTCVTHVVIGWGTPAEVTQSVEWAEVEVPAAVWSEAKAAGLLSPAVVATMQQRGKRKRDM